MSPPSHHVRFPLAACHIRWAQKFACDSRARATKSARERPTLAQTAEWTDENLKFVVGTMADQIVATIC